MAVKASDMAKVLGRRGGVVRARCLPATRRAQIASMGGTARARSIQAARRIAENFRYVAALDALRGPSPSALIREKSFAGTLPGIYPNRTGARQRHDGLSRRSR